MEAQVLEIIQELRESPYADHLSIKEITERMSERHGDDFERKVTPHWIGYIVRRKLGLKTYRRSGSYRIADPKNKSWIASSSVTACRKAEQQQQRGQRNFLAGIWRPSRPCMKS